MIDFRRNSIIWERLSYDDKLEYERLRNVFFQNQNHSTKDRRGMSFSDEINLLIKYISRNPYGIEDRCIIVGICFVGSYALINTQHLKVMTFHCKSSLNGNFQKYGYLTILNKTKIKPSILQVLPSLRHEMPQLRHWTIRCAFENVQILFSIPYINVQIKGLEKDDFIKKVTPLKDDLLQSVTPLKVEKPMSKMSHSVSIYQFSNFSDQLFDALLPSPPSNNTYQRNDFNQAPHTQTNSLYTVSVTQPNPHQITEKSVLSVESEDDTQEADDVISRDSYSNDFPTSISFDFLPFDDRDWDDIFSPIIEDHYQSIVKTNPQSNYSFSNPPTNM